MKESIFWLTFKNAMAQRNQMNILPVTASFPWFATACSTSASVSSAAKTGKEQSMTMQAVSVSNKIIFLLCFMCSS